ncbi:hypothetical protein [uncultured Lactobacillus sp.]|uniref:hypothetical protein n=1 Tax=uncultured Lactobacillus sp. TaxID=153152 RepID=UPI00262AE1C5|nr:hypothetical protein [uncultured Lactobacillus sp.]
MMKSSFSDRTAAGVLFASNAIADGPQDGHKQLFFASNLGERIKKGEFLEITK